MRWGGIRAYAHSSSPIASEGTMAPRIVAFDPENGASSVNPVNAAVTLTFNEKVALGPQAIGTQNDQPIGCCAGISE